MARKSKRKKNEKKDMQEVAERAQDLREQAKELAGEGSDAFRDFSHVTSVAAKDFAKVTLDAAKELMESVEKANERINKEQEKKSKKNKKKKSGGRKLVKTGLVLGAGAAVLANERSRELIAGQVRRLTGGGEQQSWETVGGDGEVPQQPARETAS